MGTLINIFCDWDGTIVRSNVVKEALIKKRESFKFSNQPGLVDAQKEIFFRIYNGVHKKLSDDDEIIMSPSEINNLIEKNVESESFRKNYTSIINEKVKSKIFYDKMDKAIEKLAKDKDNILILTSGLRKGIIFPSLEYLCMREYFNGGVYANTFDRKYSKIDLVKRAFNDLGAEGTKCVVFGDKKIDGLAAKEIKGLWIYPTWSKFGSKYADIADYAVDTSEELIQTIKKIKLSPKVHPF